MASVFSTNLLPTDVDESDTLYVTDRDLNVVYSNAEWAKFANRNAGAALLGDGAPVNLLDNFVGRQCDHWQHIYRLLREGRLPHHQERMDCSSPNERRIYQLRVTPRRDESGDVAWFIHHNVRVDGKLEVVDRVAGQLDQLKHPRALTREFQNRIVDRQIRVPSFEIASHFEPLEEIGGDLVWHREYPNGTCDLIHADVMGHGADAGAMAAKMAVILDELAAVDVPPAETVAALNRAMRRIIPDGEVMFATGLCLRFEENRHRVVCCDFGHESPIFSRSGEIQIKNGLPVGLVERNNPWLETILDLSEHGTRFLVYSDGIIEQFNSVGAMFGVRGLSRAFRTAIDLPVAQMLDRIIAKLRAFQGSALAKDDQTLLAIEFNGQPMARSD